MSKRYKLKIDFYSDWIEYLKSQLTHLGYADRQVKEKYCLYYFNALHRMIVPVPRKVLFSMEFSCPTEHIQTIETIKDRIEQGLDITPYLSKNIKKQDYHDKLLNEWGIYHLHLGQERESSKFIERTKDLLFVRFDERYAYFLKVMSHGDWAKSEMVEIVHKNWPDRIKQFRLAGVHIEENMSEEDRRKLRKAGANTLFISKDGTVYAPIGGGYTIPGISINVVRTCDYIKKRIELAERDVVNNFDNIVKEEILPRGIALDRVVMLNLEIKNNRLYVMEKSRKFAIDYGDLLW